MRCLLEQTACGLRARQSLLSRNRPHGSGPASDIQTHEAEIDALMEKAKKANLFF